MGSYSANGTDGKAHRDITGDAAFDFSGGTFTITMKYRCENLPVVRGLWRLYKDANNYLELTQSAAGALTLSMFASSAEVIGTTGLTTPDGVIIANQKHTIEVGRDASNNWYIFVDGALKASTTDSSVPANDYTALHVGFAKVMYGIHGSIDEFKIDKGICRHTASYLPMTSPYSSSSVCNVYIASTRPLKGIKPYIGTANTSTATVSGTYWNGSWTALTITADNTSSGGKTLAQTGTITWNDTQSDAKVKIINNQQYYWYNLVFTGIDPTTTIYYCTVDAEIQTIKDIWDGTPRVCSAMMTYATSYSDYTLNVYKNDYLALYTDTYVNISDMTSSQFMIFGFVERTMAIYLGLAEGYANTTASTVATIYYWNGSTWTSVGTLTDGTSQNGISLSRPGYISWDAPAPYLEYTWTPNNGTPLYYYKLAFNNTIDNTDSKIYLNYVAGVPAQRQLHSYKFPLFWQNRLFLCGDQSGRKNVITYSAMDTNCVFNGTDSGDIPIDGDDELMAGATLFTRFGGDVYDSAIACKRTQTFLLDNDPDNASRYVYKTVSTNKGCVAPYTMRLCDISFDIATNIKKHVVIWLSDSGLMVFDGVSLGTISDTFRNIFDPLDPNYINKDYIEYSYGEFDASEQEYILVVPIGSTPTWKEIHYKLKQQSAFWVDRGTGKALRCMFPVEDSRGNRYLYGGTNDGYVERLEYGTTMDGNGIAYTMWLPDIDFTRTALVKTKLEAIQLVGIAKSLTASTVTVTHYIDGATTGTTLSSSISQASTGNRIYRAYIPMSGVETAVYHSVKITITTTEENRGYEPILVSFFWKSAGQVAY
jgi:hypothetical protein